MKEKWGGGRKRGSRGTVRKCTPRTQRRGPALFSGGVADECVEAGLVAGGEGAALESLECGRGVSQRLRRIDGALVGVREDVGFAELAVAATSDRQEVELAAGWEGTVRADGRQVHHTLRGPGPSLDLRPDGLGCAAHSLPGASLSESISSSKS